MGRTLLADTPFTSPHDRDPSEDETLSRPPGGNADAPSSGTDFHHGRFEPGQRLGSRYRIVGLLGAGGMGEVYRADDLELGQSVALKFLPERVAADEVWLARFRHEVRTAREVAHPNICRIYDIGRQDEHVFLTMEYIDGEDLASVLRRMGRPSSEKAIEIARQICLGLAAAHERKVLHRDLKPANIMIDGRGRVRITDFGLAGFLEDLEAASARAGTPAYMAPEQLEAGRVSVRSDIYTLGLILHELFTGKSVFETSDVEELKRRHASGSVTSPSSLSEAVDPAVERVISRCLEAEPEARPQSVYQVLAALPGGDPLAAALAAGETPSPELVANARGAGGLRPAVSIGLLMAVIAFLSITTLLNTATTVMPARAPATLSVVAEQILTELGYVDLPAYSVSGYDVNAVLSESLRTSPRSSDELAGLPWPPRYRYWQRWSAEAFIPSDMHAPEEFIIDGPVDAPNRTATVAIDSRGRLLALTVPPGFAGAPSAPVGEVDWSPLFDRAELHRDNAVAIPPETPTPVYCDEVVAWRVDGVGDGTTAVTVLMGAVGGRPNYFEFLGLREDMAPNHASMTSVTAVEVFWVVLNVVIIVLAYRNLRAGRSDYRSALRCALLIAGLYGLMEVLSISVSGANSLHGALGLVNGRGAGHIVLHTVETWLYYLAIEPYVRRIWPRMLVGLLRLLSGRVRDPAVGREMLIGVTIGCGLAALLSLVSYADGRTTADEFARLPVWSSLRAMMSPAHYVSNRAHVVAWAVLDGVSYAGVLLILRLLARHALVTACLGVVVIGSMEYEVFTGEGGNPNWSGMAYAAGIGIGFVFIYARAGVLAAMFAMFVLRSMGLFTMELDAWSRPYHVALLVTLLALAGYGFWVSLAGRPIFRDMLDEPRAAA